MNTTKTFCSTTTTKSSGLLCVRSIRGSAFVRKLTSNSGGYSGVGGAHSDVHLWYHGAHQHQHTHERRGEFAGRAAHGVVDGLRSAGCAGGIHLQSDRRRGPNEHGSAGGAGVRDDPRRLQSVVGFGRGRGEQSYCGVAGQQWCVAKRVEVQSHDDESRRAGQGMPVRFGPSMGATRHEPRHAPHLSRRRLESAQHESDVAAKRSSCPALAQASSVSMRPISRSLPRMPAPGVHTVLATITGGDRTRHLYAPETVEVIAPRQPPTLDITKLNATQFRIGVNGAAGQVVVLQSSTDLQTGRRWRQTPLPRAGGISRTRRRTIQARDIIVACCRSRKG